ncbi:MAG: hypothetical protein KR126chlam2_00073 [Chlamydiae bacterium]|nr:hypothetical protein [Chlamydiota bacterium]
MKHIIRDFTPPESSFFLFGPRGTGKSTWLRYHFPQALWIDLLDPELLRLYGARPERLRETIDAHPSLFTIVIDEVQKVPTLLPMVHALIEERKELRFILTGSSSRKLKRDGVNLLAGRALLKHMHPFSANELKDQFSLEKALEIGLLPLVWGSKTPQETLKAYAGLYLKEEVQAEGLVRQVGNFARFLEVISFSHGNVINTTNIARECAVNRKTIENYIHILEDSLLSFTLPVFSRRAKRGLATHPKFYLFDPGVYRSLRQIGPFDRPEEIQGAALEGLIAEHLRTWIDGQTDSYDLAFWRTRSGLEVDFVVYGPEAFWAIEVKNNQHISPKDLKGLEAFKADYPEAIPILLYRGRERLLKKGIYCLPCEEFLLQSSPSQAFFHL